MKPSSPITRAALWSLLSASFALPSAAAGADLHVTTDGTGNCSTLAQACDFETGVAAAHSGDRVILSPGVYGVDGAVQDSTSATGVTILGVPNEARPVLDVTGGSLSLTHGTSLVGLDINTTGGTALAASGGLLDRLRISATGSDSTALRLGARAILRNSTVMANGARSTGVDVGAASPRSELRGATVVAAGAGAVAMQVRPQAPSSSASVRAVNSIIFGAGGALDLQVLSGAGQTAVATLDHSTSRPDQQVTSGTGATIVAGITSVFDDPLFIDRANGDLRQTSLSPTLDAGTPDIDGDGDVDAADVAAAGATDLDGSTRRLGLPDVGADEREMPPIVQKSELTFDGFAATLHVTVQPRGLVTQVAAEWSIDGGSTYTSPSLTASGNDPVMLNFPLGTVPSTARGVLVRARASNSAGSDLFSDANVAVPRAVGIEGSAGGFIGGESSTGSASSTTTTTTKTTPGLNTPAATTKLPGAFPSLLSPESRQASGLFAFRLRCRQTISCRGQVVLTRLGSVRKSTFKIPPGAVRTVRLSLTAAQTQRVRARGRRGLRGLLEVRSLDQGSTWTAVRLLPAQRTSR